MLSAASGVVLLKRELSAQVEVINQLRAEGAGLASQVQELTAANIVLAQKHKQGLQKLAATMRDLAAVRQEKERQAAELAEQVEQASAALREKAQDLAMIERSQTETLAKVSQIDAQYTEDSEQSKVEIEKLHELLEHAVAHGEDLEGEIEALAAKCAGLEEELAAARRAAEEAEAPAAAAALEAENARVTRELADL